MDPTPADELATDWYAAWNAHDLDRIVAHYAEEVVLVSPVAARLLGRPDGTVRGRRELRNYVAKGLAAYPDLHFEPLLTLTGARSVTLLYLSINDTVTAETMELRETDRLIVSVRAHYAPRSSLVGNLGKLRLDSR